jgi:3-oxoacyl-[acyl-carrier protein] reductase
MVVTSDSVGSLPLPLQAVVLALGDADLGAPQPLASVAAATWQRLVDAPLREYLVAMQAAHRLLRDDGGQIVVLLPTIGVTGAAELTPWATVAEGQRAMAKSAARVWGADGITVNCLVVPTALLAPSAGERPHLQQPALTSPSIDREVAAAVATICADGARAVTGATIGVDGGQWMPS